MGFSASIDFGALAGGLATGAAGILQGYWNKEQQEKNLDYQKDLQNTIFGREDTSIQRRVNDLKAAGLSPVLAAGQGAGTGSIVSTQAPQMSGLEDLGKAITSALAVKQMDLINESIDKTKAENILIQKQQHKTDVDSRLAESAAIKNAADTTKVIADTALTNLKSEQQGMDNANQRAAGTSSNPSGPAKMYRDFFGIMNNLSPSNAEQFFRPAVQDATRTGRKPSLQFIDPKTGKVVTKY